MKLNNIGVGTAISLVVLYKGLLVGLSLMLAGGVMIWSDPGGDGGSGLLVILGIVVIIPGALITGGCLIGLVMVAFTVCRMIISKEILY